MLKARYFTIPLILLVGMFLLSSCTRPLPLPPLPPLPSPTPTPSCGLTDLGSVLCAASTTGVTIIRDLATWNAFASATTCAGSTAPPIPDFNTQMVLVYSSEVGQESFNYSTSVGTGCLYSDRLEVDMETTYQLAILAPTAVHPCFCKNRAVAVPATSLPIHFTHCWQTLNLNTLVSSGCTTTTH